MEDRGVIPKQTRPRISLIWAMILVAILAAGLGAFRWWTESDPGAPFRHAWDDPITIRAARHEALADVLEKIGRAMGNRRLRSGPMIYVDQGALKESGRSLDDPIGADFEATDIPAREVLERLLKPSGLACRAQHRTVLITTLKAWNEPVESIDEGRLYCHRHGGWPLIRNRSLGY